jgi:AraC-like DNA-binding protein
MIGSQLLGQQPTFRGADFLVPEIALFGYYQFRSAVATADTWEEHQGVEILFMRSGEACWELADERFLVVRGGHAVMFPPGTRHRIANGVYTPCRLLWMVFDSMDAASQAARLFPRPEIEALFDISGRHRQPVELPELSLRNVADLGARLSDEDLLIGTAPLMADVRSRIYSSVVELWETYASGRRPHKQSQLVSDAAALLRENAEGVDCEDGDKRIEEVARQLGYGKSRLYSLFTREIGMAPNDYRQRVRIRRCCQKLVETDDSVTSIGVASGFGSSQYFARVFRKYVGVTPTAYRRVFGRARRQPMDATGRAMGRRHPALERNRAVAPGAARESTARPRPANGRAKGIVAPIVRSPTIG